MLTRIFRTILALFVILAASWLACAPKKSENVKTQKEKTDQKLKLSDLPTPVRTTVEKLTAGGVIKKIEKDEEDGKVVYDVEAKVKNQNVEFDIASDGTILTTEESVPYASLPAAVRSAAEKYFGTAEGLEANKEVEKGKNFYEVEGKKQGWKVTIKLTETGQIVEEEKGE
ncbi:MAG: PepSY domain-containing protein [bacterium]